MSSKLFLSILTLFVLASFLFVGSVGASSEMWNQTYGGIEVETAYSLVETSDGGYAIAGGAIAIGVSYDFWLVKTDRYGSVQWNQSYGGSEMKAEIAHSLVETSDGGYAIAGYTRSFGDGSYDFWLVKTDEYGNVQWNRTYGGPDLEEAYSLVETSDGGYALAGRTESFGHGNKDFWLIKTDAYGNMEWSRTYGGTNYDIAHSLVEVSDGGYAIAGGTESFGAGKADFWLIKTDANGNMEWNQTYGGPEPYGEPEHERARSLVETSDGGYALAGITTAGNSTVHPFDTDDIWVIKTDGSGKLEWNQTYGGTGDQGAYSLVESSDGGYVLAGYSLVGANMNFLVIKTDEFGTIPEFPSWAILPLLLVTTLTVIIYRKKLHRT